MADDYERIKKLSGNYDPTEGMTPLELLMTGLGAGWQTTIDDWRNVLSLRRPTVEEATEWARAVRPLQNTGMGGIGYDVATNLPFPSPRMFLPQLFREGQDADRLAARKQYQDEMRARLLRPYQPTGPVNVNLLRSGLPGLLSYY